MRAISPLFSSQLFFPKHHADSRHMRENHHATRLSTHYPPNNEGEYHSTGKPHAMHIRLTSVIMPCFLPGCFLIFGNMGGGNAPGSLKSPRSHHPSNPAPLNALSGSEPPPCLTGRWREGCLRYTPNVISTSIQRIHTSCVGVLDCIVNRSTNLGLGKRQY